MSARLRCPYCSNPLELDRRSGELDTQTWQRVLGEAAALGVLHVHLSGGEPTARNDIVEITKTCADLGLYSNLITSGVGGVFPSGILIGAIKDFRMRELDGYATIVPAVDLTTLEDVFVVVSETK